MAIFYDYIKGIDENTTTITKIYFPPVQGIKAGSITAIKSDNYPVIRLFNATNNLLKQDLGEIITSEGPKQTINNLNCDILKIGQLEGTNITIGTEATVNGELNVTGTINAPNIISDQVTLQEATINANTTITSSVLNGTIQLGTASLSNNGVLTVNKINFV